MGGRPDIPAAADTSLRELAAVFLGFGLRAWGGPAAQIAMVRDDVVARGWIDPARFNRLLAVYQILPGPEATEMCVHLGLLRRGRLGAIVAGLGFLLPGLILMLLLSWAYVAVASTQPGLLQLLVGFPPAVAALVAMACIRLGNHALHDNALALAGLGAAIATVLGAPFYAVLPAAGLVCAASRPSLRLAAVAVGGALWILALAVTQGAPVAAPAAGVEGVTEAATTGDLGLSGLKAGLLTFGGAYTSIPFVEGDAVGRYLSEGEFVDGLALAGILPAPLIIFATFVGFVGGGLSGSLAMTAGIFLPAFAFTLAGHRHLESLSRHARLARFLDGVTAGVIGLLAVTAYGLVAAALSSPTGAPLLLAAFFALAASRSKWATPAVVLGCGALGAAAALAGRA